MISFSKLAFPEDRDCSNECKHFHCRYILSGFYIPSSFFFIVYIPYCLSIWAFICFLLNRLFWLLSSHDKPSSFFSPILFSLHSSLSRSEKDQKKTHQGFTIGTRTARIHQRRKEYSILLWRENLCHHNLMLDSKVTQYLKTKQPNKNPTTSLITEE